MKIAICEDDLIYSKHLSDLIAQWSIKNDISVEALIYSDAESLLIELGETVYDVFFLDIEMKRMSGMELANLIRRFDDDVIIIFVTSHSSYSLEGYEVTPLHFLTKPVSSEKIFSVLDKAFAIYNLKGEGGFLVNSGSRSQKVPTDKILYISTMSHSTVITTIDESIDANEVAQHELEKKLPAYFLSCHRSYIVNMRRVNAVFSDRVVLFDGTSIPVSRRNAKKVQEYFVKLNSR